MKFKGKIPYRKVDSPRPGTFYAFDKCRLLLWHFSTLKTIFQLNGLSDKDLLITYTTLNTVGEAFLLFTGS
jgi:hypothetical protein